MNDEFSPAEQYAHRDHMELGEYYTRHVSAMTGERLYRKSHIAAELAWRDREIERLKSALVQKDEWRALALQFDEQRMQAMQFLRQILNELPADQYPFARTFLQHHHQAANPYLQAIFQSQ